MHRENCQLKSTLLDYSTDRIFYVGCIFKIFAPPKAEDCTPQMCKLTFVLIKFIVAEYDSFRFSLSFSASFWMVFVEPGVLLSYTQKLVEQSCCVPQPEFFDGILMF